jgi:hypothetical protein
MPTKQSSSIAIPLSIPSLPERFFNQLFALLFKIVLSLRTVICQITSLIITKE